MLAETSTSVQASHLDPTVHLQGTARYELLDFIAGELPYWRDHPDRKPAESETALTSGLCEHLNSAAHRSVGWSRIQFRTEVRDEIWHGRAIDLAPKPCAATIFIDGRRHTQFDALLPIECKRLPTPKGKDRDEREYVITNHGTTGGIQRFKFGYHGADHKVAAMLGYIQNCSFSDCLAAVNGWIRNLSAEEGSAWTIGDCLQIVTEKPSVGLSTFKSNHNRGCALSEIELRHLWINMN